MARSYFNRVATPTHATTLAPPRPITTLWKAARLERMSGETAVPIRDSERSVLDVSDAVKVSPAKTLVNSDPERDGPAGESRDLGGGFPPTRTAEARVSDSTQPKAKTRTDSRDPRQGKQRDLVRESSRRTDAGAPMHRSLGEDSLVTDMAAVRRGHAEHLHPAVVPGIRRDRGVPSTGEVRSEVAHTEKKNSLHIGKIEVQVVPPRVPAQQASPSKPRSLLARGYTLWTHGQHQ
jgi:hypothetical protein